MLKRSALRITLNRSTLCLYLLSVTQTISALDNPHFYRTNFLWGEPRIDRAWLTTVDVNAATGSSRTARDIHGKKTTLLNILGPHNLARLGSNVPGLDPADPLDKILLDAAALPENGSFGFAQFKGHFRTTESFLNVYQNLANGFFAQLHIPVRNLHLRSLDDFKDLSPDDPNMPNKNTPEWRSLLENLKPILHKQGLLLHHNVSKTGFGDLSLLLGWTWNYQDTCTFDYLDLSAKIGLLISTSNQHKKDTLFSLSTGYDGYSGVPVKFAGSCGIFDWLTIGCNVGALFFFDRTIDLRMKTDERQNGFIKLARGIANVERGAIWDLATYIKADHVLKGFSFLFGYTYTKKDSDTICPHNLELFNKRIVTTDTEYQRWRMHALHFLFEYDFAEDICDIGPRIGFCYNLTVGGSRIFNTSIKAGYVGIDIAWKY